jgi:hypothetical protein
MGNLAKGVVLWVSPDRRSLAGATNTNEAALIPARGAESMQQMGFAKLSGTAWNSPLIARALRRILETR